MDERPTFGSLFAGIGGIDLGLERAGWRGRWQVEYEPFCQRVLAKHWPDVHRVGDVHDAHGPSACPMADTNKPNEPHLAAATRVQEQLGRGSERGDAWAGTCPNCIEPVDLIAGGFPCQPFSFAGKQQRLADDRWLWPEFERCIRELRPRYVLVENVPGLLVGGGMDAVLGGLANLGYDTEWESIPASAVGAPHLRYRVWIIGTQQPGSLADARSGRRQDDGLRAGRDEPWAGVAVVADADEFGGLGHGGLPVNGHTPHRDDANGCGSPPDVAHPYGNGQGRASSLGPPGVAGLRASEAGPEPDGAGLGEVADADGDDAQGIVAGVPHPQERSRSLQRSTRPCGHGDGWWATEPDVGRVAHGVPARVDRLRSLGNAVVPQVVEFIGRRILEAEAS